GFMIRQFIQQRNPVGLRVGLVGFGPIGQHHLQMCHAVLGERVESFFLYDLLPVRSELIPEDIRSKVVIAGSWEEAFSDADIFITCTVSKARYIDKKPKPGSLHL